MNAVHSAARRTLYASLGLGLPLAVFVAVAFSAVDGLFYLVGLITGMINLYALARAVEHGLQPKPSQQERGLRVRSSRRRSDRVLSNPVQVFFLLHFLLRYVLVFLMLAGAAYFSIHGLVAAAGGFLLPQVILWTQAFTVRSGIKGGE